MKDASTPATCHFLASFLYRVANHSISAKHTSGTTKPAAIITYCLVAIVHHDMKLERSTYEVLQILSISLTDKTHLTDLFDKTKFNNVKELDCPLIPGLFD